MCSRLLILLSALCLASCSIRPEQETKTVSESEFILRWLKAEGHDTQGLVVSKDGPDVGENHTYLHRNGKLVGYHKIDTIWERRGKETEDLTNITSIQFGYEPSDERVIFTIEDPEQIAVWCAEYINTTEHAKNKGRLIPLTKDAGFPELQCEAGKSSGHCCSIGLRFFRKNKVVLTLDGHLDTSPEFDGGLKRNEALHRLVKGHAHEALQQREAKKRAEEPSEPADPNPFDPQGSG